MIAADEIPSDLRNVYAPNFRRYYDDCLQYLPAGVMVGMKLSGVKGRSSWKKMLLADAFSVALMAGCVNGGKSVSKVSRPDICSLKIAVFEI